MTNEGFINPEQRMSTVESIVTSTPEVAGLQAYEYFRSDAGKQKDAYTDGQTNSLSLTYPELTDAQIGRLGTPMQEALVTLMPGERTAKNEALYRAVEYRYSELFMMYMAKIMNSDTHTEVERTEAREWFMLANEGLYGAPEKDVFSTLARKNILAKLETQPNDSESVISLRTELGDLVGTIDESDFEPFKPSDEIVEKVSALVHERFDELVEHIQEDKTYGTNGMVEALQTVADKLGATELGWKVVIVPNSSTLAVAAHKKQIEVGEDRPEISGKELRGKALHEGGVHMGRSVNAEKAGWLSAAYGQDGYLDFEESFATALEDAYKGKFANHGENYYVIAGLAFGLDNHTPRNFNDVFEITWRSNVLSKVDGGTVTDEMIQKAKSSAFTSCLRLFRGTDTAQPGVVYLKDLAYFNGQERAWSVLKEANNQEDLEIAFAGKLDITRSDHLEIAQQIVEAA